MAKTVKVYGQKGEVRDESLLNARDLVNGCNGYWKWDAAKPAGSPMDPVPFARSTPPSKKSATQEILDRMGTGSDAIGQRSVGQAEEAPEVVDEPAAFEEAVVEHVAPAEEEVDVDDEASDDVSVVIPETPAAKRRRQAREAKA